MPDSFPSSEWPKNNGRPLSFLAQLDLEELQHASGPDWLPAAGKLLFFYEAEEQPWGFRPEDRHGWRVIHVASTATMNCQDTYWVRPMRGSYPEKRMKLVASQSLPDATLDRIGVDVDGLSDQENDRLIELAEAHFDGFPAHQVGGYPRPVQSDFMELEVQLVSHGLYCGDSSGYNDPRAKELEPGAKDWTLLLQLDSDQDANMMWGDCGKLYFWIREQDARRGDFSNVWVILQCS